jgi:hypothetical protein
MSRASEREAARKAAEILARATKRGDTAYDGEYGQGRLTKAQRESQERHIPMTERKNTLGAKLKRAWID